MGASLAGAPLPIAAGSALPSLLGAARATAAPDVSIGHLLMQMVVALLVIVGGIWAFGKLAGRTRAAGRQAGRRAGGFFRPRPESGGLHILSRQPLGKNKCLAVVQVGEQQFLVGIADSGLTPLGELRASGNPGSAEPSALLSAASQSAPLAHGSAVVDDSRAGGLAPGSGGFGVLDLSTIDLGSFGSASPADGDRSVAAGPNRSRSVGTWLESLREATVRR